MHLWAQHAAAYGKMETFEVSLMRCIYKGKQFSWLLALSVPPGIAGFILHTPYSFLWGIIGFILCGLIGPFLYYFVKREDLGDAEGPYHSAAHLAAWSALSVFFLAIVWCFLDLFQEIWEREMIFAALSIPVMAAAVFLSMLLDDALAHVYIFLRRKNENIAHWLACCYFIGLVPASIIVSVLFIYFFQGMRLDPYTELFFVSTILEKTFFPENFSCYGIFCSLSVFCFVRDKRKTGNTGRFYRFVLFDADLYSDYHITPSADGRGMACLC